MTLDPQAPLEEAPEDLETLRRRIDEIDASIVRLLAERGRLAQRIGTFKEARRRAIYAPERERCVLDRVRELNRKEGVFSDAAVAAIYREIISATRALERRLRIAYFGDAGSFTHLAARRHFGEQVDYLSQPTQRDVFRSVERNEADYGVVPVENSTQGVVIETLDLFSDSPLKICGEILLQVHHQLAATCPLEAVRVVYSHQQALAQCRNWLSTHLPQVAQIVEASTSAAAKRAGQEPNAAAICSRLAADIYGLQIVAENIEDRVENLTRFLVIGHHAADPSGEDKTSIQFMVKDEVGALVRVLERFRDHGVNLTSIDSRPSRRRSWEYLFYVDLEGHAETPPLSDALREIEPYCLSVRVLGSYPRGEVLNS
ncbi:MAG: P-protein [Candidatus Poribacteria bacterium]|nr:MAG: P-protein [Candidatus Poribacteria bacterium]